MAFSFYNNQNGELVVTIRPYIKIVPLISSKELVQEVSIYEMPHSDLYYCQVIFFFNSRYEQFWFPGGTAAVFDERHPRCRK